MGAARRVLVLADDVIWAERLVRLLKACGATPILRSDGRLPLPDGGERPLAEAPTAPAAVVDLEAHSFDGTAAVTRAREAGLVVLALGPHGAVDLQRAVRAAGAEFVPYRRMAQGGVEILGSWLARIFDSGDR